MTAPSTEETKTPEVKKPPEPKKAAVRREYVRSASGNDFHHLFVPGLVFDAKPVKVEVDNFILDQEANGKLVFGEE